MRSSSQSGSGSVTTPLTFSRYVPVYVGRPGSSGTSSTSPAMTPLTWNSPAT